MYTHIRVSIDVCMHRHIGTLRANKFTLFRDLQIDSLYLVKLVDSLFCLNNKWSIKKKKNSKAIYLSSTKVKIMQ